MRWSARLRPPGGRARKGMMALALCVAALAGCAVGAPIVVWADRVPTAAPQAIASQPVVTRGPDSITLKPISPRGAIAGVPYGYDMPHCGIRSPIDVDGSFWDAVGIAPDSVEFDGTPGVFRLATLTTATFTTSDGRRLELVRHDGAKAFPYCD